MRRMVGAWILVAALGCGFEDDMVVDEPDETEPDSPADDPDDDNGEPEPKPQHPLDIKVDVPVVGPYGARTVRVPARTHWVNTGLYLRAGETADISATGSWSFDGVLVDANGNPDQPHDLCDFGTLVVRSGLSYNNHRTCIGDSGTFTADVDGIVYLGMYTGTDLGEFYGDRLRTDGELEVQITSDGDTVPHIDIDELESIDLAAIASGWVEIHGDHIIVTLEASQAVADLPTAAASLATLDEIYDAHAGLRGDVPFEGQRIRFFPDPQVEVNGWYMLAGNPVRAVPALMNGNDGQRILRSSESGTDIWGFAHELGHDFTVVGGVWTYMVMNLESWPNLFTLHALEDLERIDGQPNANSYCNGKGSYLASPDYPDLKSDPFLQLCFLQEFTASYGWDVWTEFWTLMPEGNGGIPYDGDPHRAVWSWIQGQLDLAAGESTAPIFDTWSVPRL